MEINVPAIEGEEGGWDGDVRLTRGRDRISGALPLGCPEGWQPLAGCTGPPAPATVQGRREHSPGEGFGALRPFESCFILSWLVPAARSDVLTVPFPRSSLAVYIPSAAPSNLSPELVTLPPPRPGFLGQQALAPRPPPARAGRGFSQLERIWRAGAAGRGSTGSPGCFQPAGAA